MTMSAESTMISVTFPSELEITLFTEFPHSPKVVFDAHSKVEHISKTFATFGEEVITCEVDLRVGGKYHFVMLPQDAPECSFRGTFLEIIPNKKMQQTWIFDGWPGVEAIETMTFEPTDIGTLYTWNLLFANASDRAHFSKTDGIESNFRVMREYLTKIDPK